MGVQRRRIEGFLSCLKSRCEVLDVNGGKDYRDIGADGSLENEHQGGSWNEGEVGRARWEERFEIAIGSREGTSQVALL